VAIKSLPSADNILPRGLAPDEQPVSAGTHAFAGPKPNLTLEIRQLV